MLFVDDAALYAKFVSVHEFVETIQGFVTKLSDWRNTNNVVIIYITIQDKLCHSLKNAFRSWHSKREMNFFQLHMKVIKTDAFYITDLSCSVWYSF